MDSDTFCVDLHVHSKLGPDSEADPRECIERAIECGLHGIAFTEHYYYRFSEEVETLIRRYHGRILVLRGVEFSAAEGHFLVFGVDTDRLLSPYAPAKELIRAVNGAGGVVIPSHPYRGGSGVGDLAFELPGIAAVEGCNGVNLLSFDERAIREADRRGMPHTGGSDAHFAKEVGSCYTVFDEQVTAENFVELLKRGGFRARRRRTFLRGLPLG